MIPGHDHDFGLVVPFQVVTSKGGPYDDEAFVAGYQCGEIDAKLAVAAAGGLPEVKLPIVRRALLPQLELHGMRYGYTTMTASPPVVPGLEDWCAVTFARPGPAAEAAADPRAGGEPL